MAGLLLTRGSVSYWRLSDFTEESTVVADITKFFDKEWEQKEFAELAEAPVGAIAGVSEADAEALRQTLGIKTIRDLAENKYVLIAQAVVALSRTRKA